MKSIEKSLLLLDTSRSDGLCVIRIKGNTSTNSFPLMEESNKLIPLIDNLLKQHQATLSDIQKIFVCVGPGRFSGCRVGMILAQTLAWGLSIPLIPFHSLMPFHRKNTTTIFPTKLGYCFTFDGISLQKISYQDLYVQSTFVFSTDPSLLYSYWPQQHTTLSSQYDIEQVFCTQKGEKARVIY